MFVKVLVFGCLCSGKSVFSSFSFCIFNSWYSSISSIVNPLIIIDKSIRDSVNVMGLLIDSIISFINNPAPVPEINKLSFFNVTISFSLFDGWFSIISLP